MKTKLSLALGVALLTAMAAAQSDTMPSSTAPQATAAAQNSDSQAQSSNPLPAGTIIAVELSKSIDAKKAKTGDKVEAKIPADLLAHGKIVIPRNTKMVGHITEVKARSKESRDSMVGISFDRVVMKDGRELRLQAAIQAIGRPLQNTVVTDDSTMNRGAPTPSGTGMGGTMGGTMSTRTPLPTSTYPADPAGRSSPDTTGQGSTVAPLGPTSQGVVGMKGLSLSAAGPASVVSSQTDNVHLDGGTQLILRTL
jgi:hypothetical protein